MRDDVGQVRRAGAPLALLLFIVCALMRRFVIGVFCAPAQLPRHPGIAAAPPETHARDPPAA